MRCAFTFSLAHSHAKDGSRPTVITPIAKISDAWLHNTPKILKDYDLGLFLGLVHLMTIAPIEGTVSRIRQVTYLVQGPRILYGCFAWFSL